MAYGPKILVRLVLKDAEAIGTLEKGCGMSLSIFPALQRPIGRTQTGRRALA